MLTAQSSIILIVDDQPTNLKMLFSLLQESGYKILVAKRGESALKKLQKVLPDLILLDVMLPGIDCFEICERLKAAPETKDIPIILMTALSETRDKIKGLKVGAVDYITKPFQQEEVLARIENQLKIRTLQKQLEEQNQRLQQEISTRRKIEERLELVLQTANDGFWDWNLASGEIYISPRCKEMIGYSDQELPNDIETWQNRIFPEDQSATLKLVEEYNSGKVSRFESIQRFHHKNGSTLHILVRALHLKDANGQVSRMVSAYTDITEVRTTLEALRNSRRLLAGVLNSSLDGVAAFSALRDSQGNIIDFIWLLLNPAAEKITRRTERELVGKQLLAEMPGIVETGMFQQYVSVVETGEALETEHYYVQENIQAWFQVAAVKLGDGFTVTFRDITERKQMEEQNQALLDAIPDIMFRQRVDGTYLDVRSKQETSIVPSQLISRNLRDIPLVVPEAVKQGIFEHLQAAVETGKIQIYEYEIPMPDGVRTYESRCVKSGADEAIRIVRDVTESKRSQAALREREAQFRGIFENAAIGIGLTGADGKLLKANPTLEAFLGYSETEMRDQDFANITYPDDRAADFTLTSEIIDGVRDSFQIEKRYIRKDGQIFWGRLTVSAVRNLAREFQYTVAILEDITEHKQATERLRLLERAIAASGNAIVISDAQSLDNPIIYVNSGFERMTGYQKEEVIGSPYGSYVQIGATPTALEQVHSAIAEGRATQVTLRSSRIDGTLFWNELCITPVRDAQGRLTHFIGVQTDTSDRKLVEEALRISEERLHLALEGSGMGLWDWNLSTGQVYFDPRWKSMLGYEVQEIEPSFRSWERLLHPEDLPLALEALNTHFEGRTLFYDIEVRMLCKSGEWKWILSQAKVMERDASGTPVRMTGTHIDISDRILAEESLRESEERFRSMADSTAVLLWMSDTEGQGTFFNKTWLAFTGRTLEEELGLAWLDNVHPDDRQHCLESCFKAIEVRENFEVEYRLLRFDGEYRWIVDLGKPRFTPNGSFAGYIGSCLDITERKQAEIEITTAKAALERQMHRVLLLERITQEIRSSLNPQQIFETAATQIGQAFGVNRCIIHTYIAKPFPRIPQVAEYTEPGYPSMMDFEIPVVGNSHAELVLSQDQAVASNDVYRDPLLEGISHVMQHLGLKSVLVVRTSYQDKPNGIICLEQCDRFRVWTAEEIELLESVAAKMGIAIAQANLLEQETQRRQELAAQNNALEKAKLEAEAANRAKSQFLSKMSHELRTPLNAILGFTQVMARGNSLTIEQLEHLRIINRSGEHLLELINDILSMSKIEAGQITLNEHTFDLYHLLDSLEAMLQLKATSKGLELIFERTPNIPQYVQTDEGKLRQILINLLGNAIKFTRTGSVTLRVRGGSRESGQERQGGISTAISQQTAPLFSPSSPSLISPSSPHSPLPTPYSLFFEIQDTGPGIAPEELDTIFNPFVQTQTGRQSMEGTGLGLPISQQFVRMLGGDITIKSTLGQGAIFKFDIQVTLATSADEKPLSSKRQVISLEPNQPSYRILVVEDVAESRQLLVKILEFVGFEVREATNGQEGVAIWESWSPHLICMDILLPIMDGYDATDQIKQNPKGKDTVIIALTASAFEEQREAILRAGCDDFLPKPFQQEVLLEKIAHHLGVRYLYEEQRSPTLDQPPAPEDRLTAEALAVMPASWVTQLHQAALWADDELMNQLAEQIPLEHGSLRRALKDMLNNFRLEELIDLTQSAGSPEG